eukprot:4181390-Pleurochrysis_carterae.AAC.1
MAVTYAAEHAAIGAFGGTAQARAHAALSPTAVPPVSTTCCGSAGRGASRCAAVRLVVLRCILRVGSLRVPLAARQVVALLRECVQWAEADRLMQLLHELLLERSNSRPLLAANGERLLVA